MNLYIFIAHDDEKNLAKAYNKCMDLLSDDDWAVFLDRDAMFVQQDWYDIIKSSIKNNPDYGFFVSMMNRVGNRVHIPADIDPNNHDIKYHVEVGKKLSQTNNGVQRWTYSGLLSGVVMIVKKSVWKKIGEANENRRMLAVDNDLHRGCNREGIKVGLITGLYVYHWYRADGTNVAI